MQKVIQRTATARKQAQKKLFRAKKDEKLVERKDTIRVRKEYSRVLNENVKAAREARWEDWTKGPLAPKRDAGKHQNTFGALDSALMNPPKIPPQKRRKHILFTPGDRVCVIRGREKGKIGEINQVDRDSETVHIKNINMADISVPDWAKASMGIDTDIVSQNVPVSIDDVRHVIALTDPETGITKDCIIEHAYAGPPYFERPAWSKLPRFSRYVSGLDWEIPWPTEEAPEVKDGEWDTLRYEVDQVTWVPPLDNPPFPSTVLDELRNKYSRFRTRHDPEYVRGKIIEEYRKQYFESQSLLTPWGEHLRIKATKAAEEKKSKMDSDGNMIMDSQTAGFISRYMEANKVKPKKKAKKQAA